MLQMYIHLIFGKIMTKLAIIAPQIQPTIIRDLKGGEKKKNVFLQEDFRNTPSQRRSPAPQLDRLVPERISKRSSLSLDLNANENGVSEESGSESEEEGDKTQLRAWCVLKTCGFVFVV